MFVLSGEGPPVLSKAMWTTHIVEGVFDTFYDAVVHHHNISGELWDDEMIWVITDSSVKCRGGGKGVWRWEVNQEDPKKGEWE
jgi:hypothetical protein